MKERIMLGGSNLPALRFEPMAVGWVAQILPLCYAASSLPNKTSQLPKVQALQSSNLECFKESARGKNE